MGDLGLMWFVSRSVFGSFPIYHYHSSLQVGFLPMALWKQPEAPHSIDDMKQSVHSCTAVVFSS